MLAKQLGEGFVVDFVQGLFGVVLERDALAAAEQALMGATARAHRQPHAFAAFVVGHGRGRVQVHRQVVEVAGGCERVCRVPIVRGAEAYGGLVDGFPAFLQIALVVDADAPQVVRAAIVTAPHAEALRFLADADLACVASAQKAHLLAALVGCIASLVAAVGLSPIYELFSNAASPVKLIALSQPGQHLLKRLFMEASGTYSHSMMVANLADSAAEAIGADSLLCKVAAYYHDIGKLENPEYFTENQHGGVNPHDNLTIMESVAIITKHPEDGVKLAKKERLPNAIIKIIDEHHGTTYPSYFYRKAVEDAKNKGLEAPDVANFRYRGHIPSSRESAIVMLADTCEAAVRSMKTSDVAGAEQLIRVLIKDKIDQDQLINSGLSFDDVEKIIIAFKQVYAGVFHERIKYPE